MARRLLLVGFFVVGPYHPGSVMQLALAALFCTMFLVIQMQLMPYKARADNFLAVGCSLSLCVLFLTGIFYKSVCLLNARTPCRERRERRQIRLSPHRFAMITELQAIQDYMSYEQKEVRVPQRQAPEEKC